MTTNLTVDGSCLLSGEQTNEKGIVADGEIQTKKGNKPKLSTHTHTISSGSSAGKTKKPD